MPGRPNYTAEGKRKEKRKKTCVNSMCIPICDE
jgi:hypothetical protein